MGKIVLMIVSLAFPILLVACGTDDETLENGTTTSLEPTFESVHERLLSQSCAASGCHGGVDPQNGLALDQGADAVYAQLMTASVQQPAMNLVEPGDPASSALYRALTGTGGFQPMPPSGQIPPADLDAIWDWIEAGADR